MSQIGDLLEALKVALALTYPAPYLVKRKLESFDEIGDAQLINGVWTIISTGIKDMSSPIHLEELEGNIQVLLLYQFKLTEGSTGDQVEDVELAKLDEIRNFFSSQTGTLRCFDIADFNQSAQQETPYGWCLFHLNWSEFD